MPSNAPAPHIDPPVIQAVHNLRGYLQGHPDAHTTKVALDGIVHRLIGDILASWKAGTSDLTFAVAHLEEVAALVPDNPDPLIELSKLCVDHGDHQAALRHADAGLELNPDSPELLMNQGLALLAAGQNDAAIGSFKHYLELDPDNPWAYNNLGDAYRTIGLYDQAENYLKLAIHKDHRFGPAHYNLAMLYMDQADWPRCLHAARTAVRFEPNNPNVHLALADAYMGLEEPQSALNHAVIATLLDRRFVEAYETLASAYLALDMYELSVAAARETLKLKPDSWRALGTIGRCRAEQGDHAEGIRYLLEALQQDPDVDGPYTLSWELGWTYYQTGEYDLALEYIDRAIQVKEFPDLGLSFARGLILLAQGKVQEAEEVYDRTLARARALDDFGAIRDALREANDFISAKGLQLDPDSRLFKLLHGAPRKPA